MSKLFRKRNFNIPFMKMRHIGYILSAIMLIISISSLCIKGLNYGIDFQGGVLVEISSDKPFDMKEMRSRLSFLKDFTIQSSGTNGDMIIIQCQPRDGENGAIVVEQIKKELGSNYTYERVEVIGPTVGEELKQKSLLASVLALLAISIYIWFRFEWPFAIGCMASLAHDLVIVIGMFSLFGWDFNMVVVAGILSLAGYDCNDTIVTYDRIRENIRKFRKEQVDIILNKSINETFSRTILTSLTTLFVVLILLFIGGETLQGFSRAMVWGTILGTYSSIFTAVPLLRYFDIKTVSEGPNEKQNV